MSNELMRALPEVTADLVRGGVRLLARRRVPASFLFWVHWPQLENLPIAHDQSVAVHLRER